MDDERRSRVLAYFDTKFKNDRKKIIAATGYSKAQIAHYYNFDMPLGEHAGINLARRLKLRDERHFEREGPKVPPPVNENFADPAKDTGAGVLDDLEALHPEDKKAWIEGLRVQADKARDIVSREIAKLAGKKEVK